MPHSQNSPQCYSWQGRKESHDYHIKHGGGQRTNKIITLLALKYWCVLVSYCWLVTLLLNLLWPPPATPSHPPAKYRYKYIYVWWHSVLVLLCVLCLPKTSLFHISGWVHGVATSLAFLGSLFPCMCMQEPNHLSPILQDHQFSAHVSATLTLSDKAQMLELFSEGLNKLFQTL